MSVILRSIVRVVLGALMLDFVLLTAPPSTAATIQGQSSGVFSNAVPAGATVSGLGTNSFTWGVSSSPSRLTFAATSFDAATDEPFSFGTLTFFNGITQGGEASSVDLTVTFTLTMPSGVTREFSQTLTLVNTPNVSSPEANADVVFLPSSFPDVVFSVGPVDHTIKILGFGSLTGSGFTTTIDRFHVLENGSAAAELVAVFTSSCVVPPGGPQTASLSISQSCPPGNPFFPRFSVCNELRDFNGDGTDDCLLNELTDEIGNKFQLWCMRTARPLAFDFYWYGLFWVPVDGTPKFAGKCPFTGGRNQGVVYHAGDRNSNDTIDCFLGSTWTSRDQQVADSDDDGDGKVDWWVFRFDVATDITKGTNYQSSAGANDPSPEVAMSFTQDPGPDFNALPPVIDINTLTDGTPMTMDDLAACDLNRDGVCDTSDEALFAASLNRCVGQPGYNPNADFDADGCVTESDRRLLFINDLAVIGIRADKNIVAKGSPVTKGVVVSIQNRSPHPETIAQTHLGNGTTTGLVRLNVTTVDGDLETCQPAVVALDGTRNLKLFAKGPFLLKPRGRFSVAYRVTYHCPDALTTKTGGDYSHAATVHHEVLDGASDTHSEDDACPRGPLSTVRHRDPNPNGKIRDLGCSSAVTDVRRGR